jgi:hypothetical protein
MPLRTNLECRWRSQPMVWFTPSKGALGTPIWQEIRPSAVLASVNAGTRRRRERSGGAIAIADN